MSEKCRQNVRKNVRRLSEDCPKNVRTHNFRTFFGQFLPIWSMLFFGDPVQRSPVTNLEPLLKQHRSGRKLDGLPCPAFPCLFGFPLLILSKEFPCSYGCFHLVFQGFCCVRQGRKMLGNLGGFFFGARRIGANPEKSDFVNFRGPD